jgi:hypothetical protein
VGLAIAAHVEQNTGAANMNKRYNHRKPDSLFLLVLIVGLGVFVSTGVSAAETLFSKATIARMMEGNMQLVPVGSKGGALHMSTKSPSRDENALYISNADNFSMQDHGVHLSFKMPW